MENQAWDKKEKKKTQLPLLLALNRICHFVSDWSKHFNEKNQGDASSTQTIIEKWLFRGWPLKPQ